MRSEYREKHEIPSCPNVHVSYIFFSNYICGEKISYEFGVFSSSKPQFYTSINAKLLMFSVHYRENENEFSLDFHMVCLFKVKVRLFSAL